MLHTTRLKQAIRNKYAWPGGYEIYGVTDDGGILCCDCMREEWRQLVYSRMHALRNGWRVIGLNNTGNDDSCINCDHCGKFLTNGRDE